MEPLPKEAVDRALLPHLLSVIAPRWRVCCKRLDFFDGHHFVGRRSVLHACEHIVEVRIAAVAELRLVNETPTVTDDHAECVILADFFDDQ